MTTAPFDTVAAGYDAAFTEPPLGRWLRAAVWEALARRFPPGSHVLELGCGTGEDAAWLAHRGVRVCATDASEAMLKAASAKAVRQGVADHITFERLDLATLPVRLPPVLREARYDGAFANFGVLNCLPDYHALAGALGRCVHPGGRCVLVVMGPFCPWEWAWYLAQGRLRTAFRRLRPGQSARLDGGATVRVWYPSFRRLARAFAPAFRPVHLSGLGVLLPPSFAGPVVARWPRLFARLAALDGPAGRTLPGRWLNDHYVLVLERTTPAHGHA